MPTKRLNSHSSADFIANMDCLPVSTVPMGSQWTYEIKLDGYRLEAVKSKGRVTLYSRRRNILNAKFGYIVEALDGLPDETVIDGELVAMDEQGRSDFHLLQSFRSAELNIHYYGFDVLMRGGKPLTEQPLSTRRQILTQILPRNEHVTLSAVGDSCDQMLNFVEVHGLEGIVAKRADSVYESGKRSAAWCKYRVNLGQEFVIGGYTPATHGGFDAIIVGVYRGEDLMFAGRVRAGFVPATRREVFAAIQRLKTAQCPFANLPEKAPGRWGQGLTADKMTECAWIKPKVVVRVDFTEWTAAGKLRHTKFVAMRDDKDPTQVVRET